MRTLAMTLLIAASVLMPSISQAAEKRVISVAIVNDREQQVKAQSPHLENCFPNLAQRIEPGQTYHFRCTVWDETKATSFVVRRRKAKFLTPTRA